MEAAVHGLSPHNGTNQPINSDTQLILGEAVVKFNVWDGYFRCGTQSESDYSLISPSSLHIRVTGLILPAV